MKERLLMLAKSYDCNHVEYKGGGVEIAYSKMPFNPLNPKYFVLKSMLSLKICKMTVCQSQKLKI